MQGPSRSFITRHLGKSNVCTDIRRVVRLRITLSTSIVLDWATATSVRLKLTTDSPSVLADPHTFTQTRSWSSGQRAFGKTLDQQTLMQTLFGASHGKGVKQEKERDPVRVLYRGHSLLCIRVLWAWSTGPTKHHGLYDRLEKRRLITISSSSSSRRYDLLLLPISTYSVSDTPMELLSWQPYGFAISTKIFYPTIRTHRLWRTAVCFLFTRTA